MVCRWRLRNEQGWLCLKKKDYVTVANGGRVGILTAGTSDIPVAEEAKVIAEEMGCKVTAAYDVGVAGIHRLLEPIKAGNRERR